MRHDLLREDEAIISERLAALASAAVRRRAISTDETIELLNGWVLDYIPTAALEALRSHLTWRAPR